MSTCTARLGASLLVLLALLLGIASVPAQTVSCTPITTLPAVINVQGVHCLTGDLSTGAAGNAIDIQVNNVVVDLNGFTLNGAGAGLGTNAVGIHALNRQNITLRNGAIRGFLGGIFLENSAGSHNGDMMNITVDKKGKCCSLGLLNTQVTLEEGKPNSLFANGGTAIVVHAKADDMKTDPSGNAGDRIACGVISK